MVVVDPAPVNASGVVVEELEVEIVLEAEAVLDAVVVLEAEVVPEADVVLTDAEFTVTPFFCA